MEVDKDVTGVILAGGQSSRMGEDKALLRWKGLPLYRYLTAALEPVCREILISTHLPSESFGAIKVIPDRFDSIGPIAGIEAGLYHAAHPLVLFVSVDTPNLSSAFFKYLISKHGQYDISLAAHQGVNEPMIGVYNRQIYGTVLESIHNQLFKPPAIIKKTNWQEIDIHPDLNFYSDDLFKNLNSPTDL